MRKLVLACVVSIAVSAPLSANTTLIGSSVTGTLLSPVTETGTNFFDPANGDVPPGYGNSTGTTVLIVSPSVGFAFLQGGGTVAVPGIDSITAKFSGSAVTISEIISPNWVNGVAGFKVIFTDPAFVGLSLSKTSDTFAQGGFGASLAGDTLTLTVGATCNTVCAWTGAQTAQFSLTPVSLPPTDGPMPLWALLALGAIFIAIASRQRKNLGLPD